DMAAIRALLDEAGVALDPDYGPISINPKVGRYVVRGLASTDARARAEQIPGVRFFADALQEPASSRGGGGLHGCASSLARLRFHPQRLHRCRRIDDPVTEVVVPTVA